MQEFWARNTAYDSQDENKITQVLDQLELEDHKNNYALYAKQIREQMDKIIQSPS